MGYSELGVMISWTYSFNGEKRNT